MKLSTEERQTIQENVERSAGYDRDFHQFLYNPILIWNFQLHLFFFLQLIFVLLKMTDRSVNQIKLYICRTLTLFPWDGWSGDKFEVESEGEGGHGSPDKTVDCQLLTARPHSWSGSGCSPNFLASFTTTLHSVTTGAMTKLGPINLCHLHPPFTPQCTESYTASRPSQHSDHSPLISSTGLSLAQSLHIH